MKHRKTAMRSRPYAGRRTNASLSNQFMETHIKRIIPHEVYDREQKVHFSPSVTDPHDPDGQKGVRTTRIDFRWETRLDRWQDGRSDNGTVPHVEPEHTPPSLYPTEPTE